MVRLHLLCLALAYIQANGESIQTSSNDGQIENQWIVLDESIRRDVLELKASLNKIIVDINTAFVEYRNFTEGSIKDLSMHIKTNMEKSDEALERNMRKLEAETKKKVVKMNETLLENLHNLDSAMAQNRRSLIDWAHRRSTAHEDILKTDVSLCVYDWNQNNIGPVNYNGRHSGYINNQKSWQVYNESCDEESCAMQVLDRRTGRFTVPPHADGLYMFTFSVTIDTWDWDRNPSLYYFRKNGHKIKGTRLYGDVGSNEDSDKFPGARTIFLELNSGDWIDVFQSERTKVPDYQASFCGSLIHLKKVSLVTVMQCVSG